MSEEPRPETRASVDLYWLPLGAGDAPHLVQWSGRLFEALMARRHHRPPLDLYHSALTVQLDGDRFVIEMAPVWSDTTADRGVVCEGAYSHSCPRAITPYFREIWLERVEQPAGVGAGVAREG